MLTLSGNDTIGSYQTALQSVQFSTSDSSASPAARTVSFAVTDSVGATSTSTAQRVIDVGEAPQPPTAINQSYTAVGNTALGVGTSPAAPAATVPGSLLNGDSDPNPGGTLTVTGNSDPAHGTVTVNSDGTFTYVPNAGFSGTDTFTYTIADSKHLSETATATVTITVGPVVWYVDNSQSAAGNGTSSSPFNTLAAANSAAGSDSIVFLYQGNATYTGGVTMQSGEALWGQPHGLTVDTYPLVAAGGSTPVITNSGGNGINLAENADVEGVNVTNPSGNGIAASGVSDATVGTSTAVAISGAGGDGIEVSGGTGNLDFGGASVTGSTGPLGLGRQPHRRQRFRRREHHRQRHRDIAERQLRRRDQLRRQADPQHRHQHRVLGDRRRHGHGHRHGQHGHHNYRHRRGRGEHHDRLRRPDVPERLGQRSQPRHPAEQHRQLRRPDRDGHRLGRVRRDDPEAPPARASCCPRPPRPASPTW